MSRTYCNQKIKRFVYQIKYKYIYPKSRHNKYIGIYNNIIYDILINLILLIVAERREANFRK